MPGRLRHRVVDAVPEPVLRRIQRVRKGDRLRNRPGSVSPAVISRYDAHAVRARTVTAVTRTLDDAEVPYVLVPGLHGNVRQVAVDAVDRDAALAALEGKLVGDGWVLTPALRRRRTSATVRAHQVLHAPDGRFVAGPENGCEIGFWRRIRKPGHPRRDGEPHTVGTRLAPNSTRVVGYLTGQAWDQATSSPKHWPVDDPRPDIFEIGEPVDIVYTWVDGDDAAWRARRAVHAPDAGEHNATAVVPARFLSRDELRYSLRSLAMYASWVRRIHLVTDNQVPDWLDVDHPKIRVIDHRDIFVDTSVLPVFNSHAIESQLHHVPDLAEHYLYLNDDFFFGRPVDPELFFHANGIAKFFLAKDPLDLDPPSTRDLPLLSAAKNHRSLLERDFGVTVRRKFRHAPAPQLRSVLEEMEKRYPELFAQVAASRFRHPDDVSVASSLMHYYAYARGRAVPADIEYRYLDISRKDTARRLDEILRQRPQVFCLNDVDSREHHLPGQEEALQEFFAAYFPLPSPYEKPTV